jgi:hypothetical protein
MGILARAISFAVGVAGDDYPPESIRIGVIPPNSETLSRRSAPASGPSVGARG